jgi:hypothetical protein
MNEIPGSNISGPMLKLAHAFDIEAVKERLSSSGGYEAVHSSPGLEIGVELREDTPFSCPPAPNIDHRVRAPVRVGDLRANACSRIVTADRR